MNRQFDLVAVGNAIMDIVCHCDDSFLLTHRLPKGCMTLVPSPVYITDALKHLRPAAQVSGGSAANVAGGLASLGGSSAFIGSVAGDSFGNSFRHDIRGIGVHFDTPTNDAVGRSTSHSLVLVTPDGQRTMLTYLDPDHGFLTNQLCVRTIRDAHTVYLEGYLFDRADALALLQKVTRHAKLAGARLAFCLPDRLCIDRHRTLIRSYIHASVDILFANEREICSLYSVRTFEEAARRVSHDVRLAVLTQSERGSVIVTNNELLKVPAEHVPRVKDVTGSGDLYASGFIYAMLRGADHGVAARLGSFAAAEIVTVSGARPEVRLNHLARLRGKFDELGCTAAPV